MSSAKGMLHVLILHVENNPIPTEAEAVIVLQDIQYKADVEAINPFVTGEKVTSWY
jgi:hypothetical protein